MATARTAATANLGQSVRVMPRLARSGLREQARGPEQQHRQHRHQEDEQLDSRHARLTEDVAAGCFEEPDREPTEGRTLDAG